LFFLYFRLFTILTNKTNSKLAFLILLFFFFFFFWCSTNCAYNVIYTRVRQLQQQTIKYSNEFFFLSFFLNLTKSNHWLDFLLYKPIEITVISNGSALVENERKKFFSLSLLRSANESARFYAFAYLTRLLLFK
jgi:hypothetical protein